ncbi:MAG TPA: AIR synthase related protein [Actinomycetota bacterium]
MALTYEEAGVDYDALDAFKRACQAEARGTRDALGALGLREPDQVRGESAYLVETDEAFLVHVEEGLGTKNLVADAVEAATGVCRYDAIGIDTVATIVNDLVTCGARPVSVAMHAAVGDASWFENAPRAAALARGFAEGCRRAGAVWGGGETPALKGLVADAGIVLAGSAVGLVRPKARRIVGDVAPGDVMIGVASSGVHTNGLTLCRALASRLPDAYATRLADGRTYGDALLDPSVIYARLVAACQEAAVTLRYAVHVTGHGWRKLMRLEAPLVYRVRHLPPPPPVFEFLVEAGPIDLREAYATFNMGLGFVLYVRPEDADAALAAAGRAGYAAAPMGEVVRDGSRRAVEIEPLGLAYDGATLAVR